MADWISFWDSDHAIYVNARHRSAHYRRIADDIARLVPSAAARVLDYGCGEALHADRVASSCARLILCEAAPQVRAALKERFAGIANIAVMSPEELAAEPAHSLDLIVLHSVAQYMPPAALDMLLARFRDLLRPGGLFVLGDVIPPDTYALTDALALLRFGWQDGFSLAALHGLVRTALSDYWRLRSTLGLTRYDESAIVGKLAAAGFSATRAPNNIGHNPARMTFVARPL